MNTIKNAEVRYYYIRSHFKQKHPVACVCLIRDTDTGKCYRGISMCSTKERSFSKVIGRGIAYGNAVFAYTKGAKPTRLPRTLLSVGDIMKYEYGLHLWNDRDDDSGSWFYFKAEHDVTLTPFERKVMDAASR